MCSFVGFTSSQKTISQDMEPIMNMLMVKGGDETSFIIRSGDFHSKITHQQVQQCLSSVDPNFPLHTMTSKVSKLVSKLVSNRASQLKESNFQIIGFSRLTPEMEELNNSISQPYHNVKDDTFIVVHGTIPDAEKIAERYEFIINVDTEIFIHLPFNLACKEVEKVGGKISAMCINSRGQTFHYNNGLGQFQFQFNGEKPTIGYTSKVKIDTNIDCRKIDTNIRKNFTLLQEYNYCRSNDETRVISLFSGGLDITCSTQKAILELQELRVNIASTELWYFDWKTRARKGEILSGKQFKDYLSETYDFPVSHEVIKVEKMFRNILKSCGLTGTRLTDSDAEGAGSHEAEAAISYVPYRNTFLMTLAAAKAEQLYPGENIVFIIGANLSEGMIYLDNSETWLTHMNNLVKVGGQSSIHFEVVAPYVNRTKTEMVKDSIENNFKLDSSYSCYFPEKNGEECGKCGSCLLKENAILRGRRTHYLM